MFLVAHLDGWYQECLQCSYWRELGSIVESEERPRQTEKEPTLGKESDSVPVCQIVNKQIPMTNV